MQDFYVFDGAAFTYTDRNNQQYFALIEHDPFPLDPRLSEQTYCMSLYEEVVGTFVLVDYFDEFYGNNLATNGMLERLHDGEWCFQNDMIRQCHHSTFEAHFFDPMPSADERVSPIDEALVPIGPEINDLPTPAAEKGDGQEMWLSDPMVGDVR